jgi:DNA-binding MarR family transcriptional regulator
VRGARGVSGGSVAAGASGPRRLRLHPALTSQPAFLVVELAAEVRDAVGTELGEAGLDWPSQLVLAVTGAVTGGLPQEALSARTGIDRSSLSFLVRDLEHDGFLERGRHPEDARKVTCRLTSAGEQRAEEARHAVAGGTREALWRLTARERRRLAELLLKALGARDEDRHWLFG